MKFSVKFSPEVDKTVSVAETVCRNKAQEIGVTQENFGLCIERVGNYLQAAVDSWYEEKVFSTAVTLKGNRFDIRFIPEVDSTTTMAQQLCAKNQQLLGISTLDECVSSVDTYLKREVQAWYGEKTVIAPIVINDTEFEISFLPERQSPVDMASKLCRDQAATLGVTAENFANCVNPVAARLSTIVQQWIDSKTLEFTLTVAQKPYQFSFMPEREAASTVAQTFCQQRATEFQLTEANFVSACVNPINEYINQVVKEWINSKIVSINVDVNNKPTPIEFIPERETTARVARRFCLQNAEALKLTEANFVDACVDPVNEGLVKAVRARAEAQRAQQQARA